MTFELDRYTPHLWSRSTGIQRWFWFDLVQLPDCFGQLKKLENIQLSQNQLHSLPSSFASLIGLRQLVLSNNRFTSIPAVLLTLTNLQLLDLSANQITEISDAIETIQVDELNLNDNRVREIRPQRRVFVHWVFRLPKSPNIFACVLVWKLYVWIEIISV